MPEISIDSPSYSQFISKTKLGFDLISESHIFIFF